jgi:hypothetical protein
MDAFAGEEEEDYDSIICKLTLTEEAGHSLLPTAPYYENGSHIP